MMAIWEKRQNSDIYALHSRVFLFYVVTNALSFDKGQISHKRIACVYLSGPTLSTSIEASLVVKCPHRQRSTTTTPTTARFTILVVHSVARPPLTRR